MAYLEEIREMGEGSMRAGVLEGIEQGYFQREIQDAAYEYQERVEAGEETVVGVNEYVIEEETDPDILTVDKDVQQRQQDRLAEVKEERDDEAVEAALREVAEASHEGENVMPAMIEAVKVYATMGEIMAVFEDQHGTYRETVNVA
jgi:methylmalonyl-CoA mutase N-terminal domain/subunit